MSLDSYVVCTYAGCYRVYRDARILPCGNRTCAEHVDDMLVKMEASSRATEGVKLNCHFCSKVHTLEDAQLPVDTHMSFILSATHYDERELAASKLAELRRLLADMAKRDAAAYLDDRFARLETDVERARVENTRRLNAHYDALRAELRALKGKQGAAMHTSAQVNEQLGLFHNALFLCEARLNKANHEQWLGATSTANATAASNELKWKRIQSECSSLIGQLKQLSDELGEKLLDDEQTSAANVVFTASGDNRLLESALGRLEQPKSLVPLIDSRIVQSAKDKRDLARLCELGAAHNWSLVYRASRDGFGYADFHRKCDGVSRTLTLVRSAQGAVFGAYSAARWDQSDDYKPDASAFIFSLVRTADHDTTKTKRPLRFAVREARFAVFCDALGCAAFGNGHDIYIANNANANEKSYARLGASYQLTEQGLSKSQAESLLAGAGSFRVTEIEIFQISDNASLGGGVPVSCCV